MKARKILFLLLPALFFPGCSPRNNYPKIVEIFERHSFKKFDSRKLLETLKKEGIGGLKKYDRHCDLVRPGEKKLPPEIKSGNFSAGLFLAKTENGYSIVQALKKSPAFAAGIRDGGEILKIDGKNARNLSAREAESAIGGRRSREIRIKFRSGKTVKTAVLKTRPPAVPFVWGFAFKDAVYLRINGFFRGTAGMVSKKTGVLTGGGKRRKLIIDLRHCAVGSAEEAAKTLSLFTSSGKKLFEFSSRHEGYRKVFYSSRSAKKIKFEKIIILADEETLSAAEIFAQSLRENEKAVVLGGKTAGGAAVLKTFRLPGGQGLTVTVARVLSPSGGVLDEGLAPDTEVREPSRGSPLLYPSRVLDNDAALMKALE